MTGTSASLNLVLRSKIETTPRSRFHQSGMERTTDLKWESPVSLPLPWLFPKQSPLLLPYLKSRSVPDNSSWQDPRHDLHPIPASVTSFKSYHGPYQVQRPSYPSPLGTASSMNSPLLRTVTLHLQIDMAPAATRAEYSPRLCPAV